MKKTAFHSPPRATNPHCKDEPAADTRPRSIGSYIREINHLSEEQVENILSHHRQYGTLFGDAAVALNLASKHDVLWALSQQFHYPYAFVDAEMFDPDLVVATDPFGEQAEIFRDFRSRLLMGVLSGEGPRTALAILSHDSGDGKSYFAANLAIALSQLGGRTLLIDADMRRPRQHTLFKCESIGGLSDILAERIEIDLTAFANVDGPTDSSPHGPPGALRITDTNERSANTRDCFGKKLIQPVRELPGLYVLPVGTVPPNPLELLQQPAFSVLLQKLIGKFDHVVVDTPAANNGADARVIAFRSGAALIVARRHRSAIKPLQKLVDAIARTPTRLAGVLVNEY